MCASWPAIPTLPDTILSQHTPSVILIGIAHGSSKLLSHWRGEMPDGAMSPFNLSENDQSKASTLNSLQRLSLNLSNALTSHALGINLSIDLALTTFG